MHCINSFLLAQGLRPFATHHRLRPLLLAQGLRPFAVLVLVPQNTRPWLRLVHLKEVIAFASLSRLHSQCFGSVPCALRLAPPLRSVSRYIMYISKIMLLLSSGPPALCCLRSYSTKYTLLASARAPEGGGLQKYNIEMHCVSSTPQKT